VPWKLGPRARLGALGPGGTPAAVGGKSGGGAVGGGADGGGGAAGGAAGGRGDAVVGVAGAQVVGGGWAPTSVAGTAGAGGRGGAAGGPTGFLKKLCPAPDVGSATRALSAAARGLVKKSARAQSRGPAPAARVARERPDTAP
jgi:hypothetical protein